MMIGRVDEVDGAFVATRFVALVPTECLYISRKGPRSDGVRIQTDLRSVALGYGRVWLPVIAVGLLIFDIGLGGPRLVNLLSIACLLGISALAYRSGRLPEREKARLRVLGTVTGLRIDPSRLQPNTREVKHASLADLMEKGGIPLTPDGILSVLEEIPMPAMPLVYGYTCYAGDEPEWRACAAAVYERYEQGEV
ncbi:MAG: hypothetical protein K0S65_3492 [Labilithrix sp.]|nr:hypothetical protein [Labilithrix sp.]